MSESVEQTGLSHHSVKTMEQSRHQAVKFVILTLGNNSTVGKGKTVLLQAWSGLEGSRKLSFPDFMTTAQDGGKVVNLTHRPPLPPGNTPGTHFC